MHCNFCSTENEEGAKFCENCGKAIIDITVECEGRISADGAEERLSMLKKLRIGIYILFGVSMLLSVLCFAGAPISTFNSAAKIIADGEEGELFFLGTSVFLGFFSGILALAGAVFSAFVYANIRKLISDIDAPQTVAIRPATTVMIFTIVAAVAVLMCCTFSMGMVSNIAMYNEMAGDALPKASVGFSVFALVLSLLSLAPIIITFIKALQFRVKIKRIY